MNMNDAEAAADSYFSALDPLATEVVTSNLIHPDWGMSHADMGVMACRLMGWEDFDLFETLDFEAVYARENLPELHAYAMLAHLRGEVFREANRRSLGMDATNEFAASHAELWEAKLADKWKALRRGETTRHRWMQ